MKVGTDGVLLGAWAQLPLGTDTQTGRRVLDIGTGTGLIAIMMAQRFADAEVTGIDIDADAVIQASANAAASPFTDRIHIVAGAVQSLEPEIVGTFDAIVCNPPYFIDSLESPDLQRTTARHAQTLTYAALMQSARRLLSAKGELSVVVPFDYHQRMEDEATFAGFFPRRVCAVRTVENKPARRYLLSFVLHPVERDFQVMTLGDAAYSALTEPFYL